MQSLVLVAIAGFCASFVDGALGMGFGVTSSTLLLGAGLTPQATSATVNLAKVVTGFAAGVSHWRFRNIDRPLALRLGGFGALGAIVGVLLLSTVSAATIKPVMALLLALVGLRILLRFSRQVADPSEASEASPDDATTATSVEVPRGSSLAGFAGGITNGLIGAWGPVVTPFLLHRGVTPRYAIGTANTSEVVVAAVSSVTLLSSFGQAALDVRVIGAMLIGGVIAAPVAAWLIRHVPARPMGLATAGLLLLTNARELVAWTKLGHASDIVYAALGALVLLAAFGPALRALLGRAEASSLPES
jgi:uncharacterized membrane protein YfcA